MTQDMTKDMILHTMTKKLVRNWRTRVLSAAHASSLTGALTQGRHLCADEITARRQRDYGSCPTRLRLVVTMLLLLTLGSSSVWGQTGTDYSGIFYFANCGSGKTNPDDPKIAGITDPDNYFYLVPADSPKQSNKRDAYYSDGDTDGDSNKPYLTTYRTKKDVADVPEGVTNRPHNSVWIVKFASTDEGTDYYYLIHAATGKYVVYEPPFSDKNNRKSVHLLTTDSPVENAKFAITLNSSYYNFRPKSIDTGASTNRFFNTSNRNFSYYYSHSKTKDSNVVDYYEGLIGLYSSNADASSWKPEATLLSAPTINFDSETNTFSISYDKIPTGYIILYTIDESIPTIGGATTSTYSGPVPITEDLTVKAVVARYGMVLTDVAEKAVAPAPCATPVITFDYTTSNVSISCSTPNSTIYYTTDGSTPTTSSTPYNASFSVDGPTTVKAIATHTIYPSSAVAELAIAQVATPTIQNNGSNAISITSATSGATIYYTLDGGTPTTSSTKYTDPLTENVSNVTIKAIAVKENMITSAVKSGTVKLQCATPVITREGMTFTLSCSFPTEANLYYKLDGSSEVAYDGTPVSFTSDQLPMTVTAVARHSNYTESETASFELLNGSGTSDDPYLIYSATDFANFITNVNNGTTASAFYKLETDVSGSGVDAITTAFTGTFDGGMHIISGLGHALFNTINGGVVKNVILDNVSISGGTNVGAICNEATGDTRIYNCGVLATNSTAKTDKEGYTAITSCSSTISGSGYVGGIAGLLDGTSRVINCFSYANITGGDLVGGIVGKNAVSTTSGNLKTMVMNCMFYGNITGGTNKAPIYNGTEISNKDNTGVGNYNYFLADATFTGGINTYNCALMAEKRFLQRFEFFRHLLNSHRELAAWWATGSMDNKNEMMKWVLEPLQIGSSTPYPILKAPGKYASVVNYTPSETAYDEANRNKGRKLTNEGDDGVLHVTIQMGTNTGNTPYSQPTGAGLKSGETGMIDLTITDKDYEHFNFNYGKVQLPYYNDYCDGNYTGNRVVTGWKIVSISGGTSGSFTSTGSDATASVNAETGKVTLTTPYNFADRNCTDKDLYSESGRVYNQGAYWDVPEGVTAITIEPYWAKAAYVADAYPDVVYNQNMSTGYNVPNVGGGQKYTNDTNYDIAGEQQKVYTTVGDAVDALNPNESHTVHDYAVVLVGNVHQYTGNNVAIGGSKNYTVTTIDLDHDNEPDYSFMLRNDGRNKLHPAKWDFLNIVGLGMAQKSDGGTGSYNQGIFQPLYWFESTNTSLFRVTQLEYENSSRKAKPLILHGGVIEQWVSAQSGGNGNQTTYIHVGSNVWFKEFHLGCHQDKSDISTKHPPVSVTGGDFDEFYLTGLYATTINYNDNAECYINGGRFDKVAGTGIEGIGDATNHTNGNIVWQIQNADIEEFYGGGINSAKPMQGNITTVITGSHVKRFCGGPKFGDMESGRTVTTTATNCTFGSFFGAGYGGNSYYRAAPGNFSNNQDPWDTFNADWNAWIAGTIKGKSVNSGNYANGDTYKGYDQTYNSHFGGVSTRFDYQFLPQSSNGNNVARLFIDFVNFSLATTRNVTSTLTGCTITGNFYGGGSLGKVDGNVTSTLTDCTVRGSVFGGGYDASRPTVQVMSTDGFTTPPEYNTNTGAFIPAEEPYNTSIEYRWEHSETVNSTETAIKTIETEAGTEHILYTTANLTTLGQVTGNVELNILGNTLVEGLAVDYEGNSTGGNRGGVFGGGDASAVLGNTTVTINATALQDGATYNAYRVYGGGNSAPVGGNSTVTLRGKTQVLDNVFGGGNEGEVGGSATVNIME